MTKDEQVRAVYTGPYRTFQGKPWWPKPVSDPGHNCPHCDRLLKVYTRKLSTGMAMSLIHLYRCHVSKPDEAYHHVTAFDIGTSRGETGHISSWGLVEAAPNEDPDRRTSGFWRLTEFGYRFVKQEERVPSHTVLCWQSEHAGFAGPLVYIDDCLSKENRFRYAELMKGT